MSRGWKMTMCRQSIIVGSPLFLVAAVICYRWYCVSHFPTKFDSDEWKCDDVNGEKYSRGPTVRQRMTSDLVSNVLPGKSKEEVISLLGQSGIRPPDSWWVEVFDADLAYAIGYERIFIYDHRGKEFSPDPEYLIIRFGEHGIFDTWYLWGSESWIEEVSPSAKKTFFENYRERNRQHDVTVKP